MNLTNALRKTGSATLAKLVGEMTLTAINQILRKEITEGSMVEILVERLGSQILSTSEIRKSILEILPDKDLEFVHFGTKEGCDVTALRGKNIAWGREQVKARRLIEILELDEKYLPSKNEEFSNAVVISPNLHLFDYQRKIKSKAVNILAPNRARLLMHMPTGAGKTRTTAETLVDLWRQNADPNGLIVWLAHSEELCQQGAETLEKVWHERGDMPLNFYRMWSNLPNPDIIEGPGVVVASLQRIYALWKSKNKENREIIKNIRNQCLLIVVDEAHKAVAPTYQDAIEALRNIQITRILGLTATPGRGVDVDENKKLIEFFNNTKITLQNNDGTNLGDPIGYLQKHKYLAKIKRKAVPTNIDIDLTPKEKAHFERFFDLPVSAIKRLGEDTERNALIIVELAKQFEAGRTIILFACSVNHSRMLTDLCRLRGIEARSIDGMTAKEDRKQWIDDFKQGKYKVLINYGVLTTGFDAPNTDTVMITRPTGSVVLYSQMIGRGIRGLKMGGNEECLLVDLEDNLRDYPSESQAFNYFQWPEES
ncbi:MAG: DEAD/DEAH box helicase [Robiginitomaculum sp.]|nr:DEAD/DEAH box helicase [Robiginitomaculum sp.]